MTAAGGGVVRVFQGHEKRNDNIPLIDEEVEEVEEKEKCDIYPPLAEPESLQLSSMDSIKEENKEIFSKENQEMKKNDERSMNVSELFKTLPLCSSVSISEEK